MTKAKYIIVKGVLNRTDCPFLTAEDGVRAGIAAAILARKRECRAVGLGFGESSGSYGLSEAVGSGVSQGEGQVWKFGRCFESEFCYCLNRSGAGGGIFADDAGSLHLYGERGLPCTLEEEKKFLLDMEEYRHSGNFFCWGRMYSMESLCGLYPVELIKSAETALCGLQAEVKCANPAVCRVMEKALLELGCKIRQGGLILQISADGKDLSVYETAEDDIHTEKICCLICTDLFRRGQDAALPGSAPRVIDAVAARYGRKVFRYADGVPGREESRARSLAARQPFLRDALLMGVRFLSILKRYDGNLRAAEAEIPDFALSSRMVFPRKIPESGMVFSFPAGELRVYPIAGKQAVYLSAEGENQEAAVELCNFGEENLMLGKLQEKNST